MINNAREATWIARTPAVPYIFRKSHASIVAGNLAIKERRPRLKV
jgi:hypothetical protein